MAARLNFAGVFTDVPPFCYDYGGEVVNTSILIDGKYPVTVEAEACGKNSIVFEYKDAGRRGYIGECSTIYDDAVQNDAFAVQRVVCSFLGLTSGLRLSINSTIPAGSGLGTSSIAAAACFKAVLALYGVAVDDMEIVRWVLDVEQTIGSGGGWQDPCGGIFQGMKLCSSQPGIPQKIDIDMFGGSVQAVKSIEKNTAILFSGNRRHSKNILKGIIDKVHENDAQTIEILCKMKDIALKMASEIRKGDTKLFYELVNEQSALNKRISSEYFNIRLKRIEEKLSMYCDASIVSGAGGGGFFAVFLKDGVDFMEFKKHMMSGKHQCEPLKVDFCIDRPAYLVEILKSETKNG